MHPPDKLKIKHLDRYLHIKYTDRSIYPTGYDLDPTLLSKLMSIQNKPCLESYQVLFDCLSKYRLSSPPPLNKYWESTMMVVEIYVYKFIDQHLEHSKFKLLSFTVSRDHLQSVINRLGINESRFKRLVKLRADVDHFNSKVEMLKEARKIFEQVSI